MFNVRFSLLFCVVYVFSGFSLKAQDVKVSYEAMGKNYILRKIVHSILILFRLFLRNLQELLE